MLRKLFLSLVFFLLVAPAAQAKLAPSQGEYILAILPLVDTSGLEPRIVDGAKNAIHDTLKEKYPPKKSRVKFITEEAMKEVLTTQPFENRESPTLKELVNVGQQLGADRVMYLGLMAANDRESGVMVVFGSGTIRANVTMKQKMVDVGRERYLYNDNTIAKGASSSVNFWRLGAPSKIRAVKKGVKHAMEQFLESVE